MALPAAAQISHRGTEFWLAFPQGNDGPSDPITLQLLISSDVDNSGQVQIPGLGFSAAYTVAAGGSTQIVLPLSAEDKVSDAVSQLGIHVTAVSQVSVYGLHYELYASDGYLGLPVEALGTSYMVCSYKNGTYNSSSLISTEFAAVATQDCTHLTVTPNITVGSHTRKVPYTVTLNQGDVYQLQDPLVPDDLTGTIVSSDKPVGVYGAHQCDYVPSGVPSCNHLVEQLWPLPYWGTEFVTMPLATRTGGDMIRFLASSSATTVTVNGTSLTPALQAGFSLDEPNTTVPLHITSNNPICVMQFSQGGSDGTTTYLADPSMISIQPTSLYDSTYTIAAMPMTVFTGNYENVVTAYPGAVTFDGSAIASSFYTPISGSSYYGVQLSVSAGTHQLAAPAGEPFGVIAYGFGLADAYGYPGGVYFSSNTPVPTFTPGGPCNTLTPTNTPTNTATVTPTNSPTSTKTPSPTKTTTPSNTPTITPTPTWTNTPNGTDSLTSTDTSTPTLTPSPTGTLTPTDSPTSTPTPSPTSTDTATPTDTASPTTSTSQSPTPTPTNTPTGTPTPTGSPTPTPTLTLSPTPTDSETPTGSPTPTTSTSQTLTPTPTMTPTLTLTESPTPTLSGTPTDSPTPTFSTTETYTPSPTSTDTLTWTPTSTLPPSPSPTVTLTPTPTGTPTLTPSVTPSCEIHVWPDPFNPAKAFGGVLKISCLPEGAVVAFYTVSGELVNKVVSNGSLTTWNGWNQSGVPVSPGIYYYVIRQPGGPVLQAGKFLVVNGD